MFFITDIGSAAQLKDQKGDVVMTLDRYGVWGPDGDKNRVIETSNDLAYLTRKYDITDAPVKLGG